MCCVDWPFRMCFTRLHGPSQLIGLSVRLCAQVALVTYRHCAVAWCVCVHRAASSLPRELAAVGYATTAAFGQARAALCSTCTWLVVFNASNWLAPLIYTAFVRFETT